MDQKHSFVKTTVLGGVIFLLPIVILSAILGKAFQISLKIVKPLEQWIDVERIIGVAIIDMVAVGLLLLICFLAGLVARSGLGRKLFNSIEEKVFIIPGYAYFKGILTGNVGSHEERATLKPVLVSLDDQSMIAFEVERQEGGFVSIYLPGVPNPSTGSILMVTEDRVRELNIDTKDALQTFKKLGRGSINSLGDNK